MGKPDLIDRRELLTRAYPFPCAIGVEYAVSVRQIKDAPSVDAEPVRHGRWIVHEETYQNGEDDFGVDYWIKCSECGRSFYSLSDDIEDGETPPYCFCGARMDAKEDENAVD